MFESAHIAEHSTICVIQSALCYKVLYLLHNIYVKGSFKCITIVLVTAKKTLA